MQTARVFLLAAAAGLLLPAAGCSKQKSQSTTPATASDPVAPSQGAGDKNGPTRVTVSPEDKVQVLASFEGLMDMLSAVNDLQARIEGEEPSADPLAEVQAGLLSQGFGPAFLGSINLDGKHAVKIAFPSDDAAGPEAIDFAATLAVTDGRKVLESMPSAMRPQPLGGEMWELRQDDETLLIKEAGAELLWGRSPADVEKAADLAEKVGAGRRIRIKAWNIPADEVNPAELLDLPTDIPIVATVADILKELSTAELQLDYGTDRQLELVASAEAPFGKLGLEPLGEAREKSTPLEAKLPAGAVFITTLAYGNPEVLNKTIDKMVPVDQVPAPFDTMVKDAVKGTHMVLNSIAANVVAALYVDNKGRATVVIAAGVRPKQEDKALEGMRMVQNTLKTAIEAHAALQGKDADKKFGVTLKEGGVKISGVKADQLNVKIAKDFQSDTKDIALFLKKDAIESVSFVQDGVALWAIGSGARTLASDVAGSLGKDRTTSMASEGTLSSLREGMDGCQVCMSFDGGEYLRVRLLDMQAKTTDKAKLKEIKTHLGKLSKVKGEAEVGVGVRFAEKVGAAGVVVPKPTLALGKDAIATLKEVAEFVEGIEAPSVVAEVETK